MTQNTRHFPAECLRKFDVRAQSADDFLLEEFRRSPQHFMDKLDDQAAANAKERAFVISSLSNSAPQLFAVLKRKWPLN